MENGVFFKINLKLEKWCAQFVILNLGTAFYLSSSLHSIVEIDGKQYFQWIDF